ncbi:hypothetical protein [Spirillospora sp. NPDC029432]|uniref:hypothetical protein n=1 Tax=Spirillospora sp. NPDC029432 TaxID=3154599 RepID=UPI003454870C
MTPDRSLRTLRAAGFGAVCTIVSAVAHRYAGGAPAGPGALALAAALTAAGAFLLGGRERGMKAILPATFAAQYGLHHLLGRLAPGTPAAHEALARPAAHAHHAHHAHYVEHAHHAEHVQYAGGGAMDHAGGTMLLAHVIVALITAAWLRRGEELFCSLVRRLATRVTRLVRPGPVPSPRVHSRPAVTRVWVLIPDAVVTAVGRRGPPAANPA